MMSVSLRRVSAVVLAVGVLTAACGGDDDSSVAGPETAQPTAEVVATPEPATTAAPPEEPVEPAPEAPETASAAILSAARVAEDRVHDPVRAGWATGPSSSGRLLRGLMSITSSSSTRNAGPTGRGSPQPRPFRSVVASQGRQPANWPSSTNR